MTMDVSTRDLLTCSETRDIGRTALRLYLKMTVMILESVFNDRNNGVANSDRVVSACHVDFCKYLLVYCESFGEPRATYY